MRFDFSDLRLFEAVVRTGSISAGAKASNMALASASARISGMEELLGAKLLERHRRGVTPTAAGRTLVQHSRAILAQIEHMRGDLRGFATGLKGEIRLLSNTAALVEVLPRALRAFLEVNPNVDIEVEEKTSVEIVAALLEGYAEFGVIADSADRRDLEVRPLGTDRLIVIAADDDAMASRKSISFVELLDERFVGLTAGALPDHLDRKASELGRRINHRVRVRSFGAIAELVAAGIGIGILPVSAAKRYRKPGLTTVPLTDDWAERRLLVAARSFADLSSHARTFIDEIERASSSN